jgi:hypothetical protein
MQQPGPIKFIGPISQENNFNMQEYYVGLEDTRCLVNYMTCIGTKADSLKLESQDPLLKRTPDKQGIFGLINYLKCCLKSLFTMKKWLQSKQL